MLFPSFPLTDIDNDLQHHLHGQVRDKNIIISTILWLWMPVIPFVRTQSPLP